MSRSMHLNLTGGTGDIDRDTANFLDSLEHRHNLPVLCALIDAITTASKDEFIVTSNFIGKKAAPPGPDDEPDPPEDILPVSEEELQMSRFESFRLEFDSKTEARRTWQAVKNGMELPSGLSRVILSDNVVTFYIVTNEFLVERPDFNGTEFKVK
jgi:hypothetical protein